MRILIAMTMVLAALTGTALAAPTDISGDWNGTLETPNGALRVILRFERDDAKTWEGSLESIDQTPGQLTPLADIAVNKSSLSFSVTRVNATYEGHWDSKTKIWDGTFKQAGLEFALALKRGLPDPAPVIAGLDGTWEAEVERNAVRLRLVLRVETGENGTTAKFDAPDAMAFGLPVSEISRDGNAVRFVIPAAAGRFDGILDERGSSMTGQWNFAGRPETTVTFARTRKDAALEERARPQYPKPPFPYLVEEVAFDTPEAEGVTLAGTLTLPKGKGPFPAVVLITGSGPQDRDETVFGHKPFAVLADHLTRKGIAVLRYDDRGFSESTGSFGSATSFDFAKDANAAYDFLRGRKEIEPQGIGFVGHSEGGLVAPIAYADNPDLDFMVLLAAPGVHMTKLLLAQRRLVGLTQGMAEDDLIRTEPYIEELYGIVAAAKTRDDAREQLRERLTPEMMEALGVPKEAKEELILIFSRDWLRTLLRHDPLPYLEKIEIPVLALNGTLDKQVPPEENLAAIEAALADNPDVTVMELESLNHMFQTAKTGAMGEYNDIEETFAPAALEIISDWITERF